MLKRRAKIQKYIATLKKKQIKKYSLKKHNVLEHKIEVADPLAKVEPQQQQNVQVEQQYEIEDQIEDRPCWQDADDDDNNQQIRLDNRNKFNKLTNFGSGTITNADAYQKKVGKFYQARYKKVNWAEQGQDFEEKDINDYLNEDVYFSDKKPAVKKVKFYAKTNECHESIVSGLDWHNNIMFTTGLDHKLKVWHLQPDETNPQLKLKQEKDIYVKDLPLSNCFFRQNTLLMGTLRKNLVQVDTEKWSPSFITSSFLKDHKTYQNLRSCSTSGESAIFSNHKISLLDKNNVYMDTLLANEPIEDVCFYGSSIYAVSNQSFYEWDVRKMGIVKMERKYLGFTSLAVTNNSINIGSKLGTVYIYTPTNFTDPLENSNLVTHITQIKTNRTGDLTLAMSKWKSNAIRVIDSLTGRSIGEWPTVKTKVGIPINVGFNEADFFGVGASSGHVSVYGFTSQMI